MKKMKTLFKRQLFFYRGNGEMCKIKRSDFGFEWNRKKKLK